MTVVSLDHAELVARGVDLLEHNIRCRQDALTAGENELLAVQRRVVLHREALDQLKAALVEARINEQGVVRKGDRVHKVGSTVLYEVAGIYAHHTVLRVIDGTATHKVWHAERDDLVISERGAA